MAAKNKADFQIKTDQETFKKQVELFVDHHRRLQKEDGFQNRLRNMPLEDLISLAPVLKDDAVERFFNSPGDFHVAAQDIEEVHKVLESMQVRINRLPNRKRFFILETINFFSSQISIGKLIPALLVLTGEEQKRAICEFALPTFLSINKNVETLVADDRLFDPKTLHIERGVLYSFVSDLAKILITLFNKEFVDKFQNVSSPIEFLLTAFNPSTLKISSEAGSASKYIWEEVTDSQSSLRLTSLKFIATIQSHGALYNYAVKRHHYYLLFLIGLTKKGRFGDVDSIDVSRILAGCFVSNLQLEPDDELIERMIDEDRFRDRETLLLKKKFLEQLAPSTVLGLINRVKASLQHLARESFEDEFDEVQKLSVKSILKTAWSGMVNLLERGVAKLTEPINRILEYIREAYDKFISKEAEEDQELFDSVSGRSGTLRYKAGEVIPKNLESFAIMTQHFQMVEPDFVGMRGDQDGASHKDFGFNIRMFKQDENLLLNFYDCIQKLFYSLQSNPKVKVIKFENQNSIKEFAISYVFDQYLIIIGITHLRTGQTTIINEKDLFPYVLLFQEGASNKSGRVASREVVIDGQVKIYNELEFTAKSAVLYYEALYLVLHLLSGKDWEARESQTSIDFLITELQTHLGKKKELKYCVNIPVKMA